MEEKAAQDDNANQCFAATNAFEKVRPDPKKEEEEKKNLLIAALVSGEPARSGVLFLYNIQTALKELAVSVLWPLKLVGL